MLILGVADVEGLEFALVRDGHPIDMPQYLPDAIDSIVYFQKPYLALERTLETCMTLAPKSLAYFCSDMPPRIKETIFKKRDLLKNLSVYLPSIDPKKLLFADRQICLCADAFYPSRYEEAAVLCLDDMGEWSSSAVAIGRGSDLTIEKEILYPHSLGFFINAFADYIGVDRARFCELAKQGETSQARMLSRSVIDIKSDGSFLLNQFYFSYTGSENWTNNALHELLGCAPRGEGEPLGQHHHNIAASVMAIAGQIASLMVHAIAREYRGIHNLCVTGSVARETIVRERILRDHPFDHVDISQQPGNFALANGAALAGYYLHHKQPRDIMFLQNLPTAA